jgi:hypothetical protein
MYTLRTNHPRVLRLATSALLLSIMLVALNVSNAEAWTHTATGIPGGVTPRVVQGLGTLDGSLRTVPTVRVNGPTVSRSPASTGSQDVWYAYQLTAWNGSSWAIVRSMSQYRRAPLSGSHALTLPYFDFKPVSGDYRVTIKLAWADATSGRILGERTIYMNQMGDFQCLVTADYMNTVRCARGSNWIEVW